VSATSDEPRRDLRLVAQDPDQPAQPDGDDPEAAPWSDGQPMHLDSLIELDEP
jgi:hypothetical protein